MRNRSAGTDHHAGRRPARRLGLWRFPTLTAVVVALTAGMAIAQAFLPDLLDRLGRTPAGLHGDWWRTATALLVQDGGVVGTLSNLMFLVLIGSLAEQVLSRPRWVAHYLGVGLATELIGDAWQPVGAGCSIAICGLTGAVALACWRGDLRLPIRTPQVLVLWSGALVATLPILTVPAAVVSAVSVGLIENLRERGVAVRRPSVVVVVAAGVILTVAANIHGAALLLGGGLAFVTAPRPGPGPVGAADPAAGVTRPCGPTSPQP